MLSSITFMSIPARAARISRGISASWPCWSSSRSSSFYLPFFQTRPYSAYSIPAPVLGVRLFGSFSFMPAHVGRIDVLYPLQACRGFQHQHLRRHHHRPAVRDLHRDGDRGGSLDRCDPGRGVIGAILLYSRSPGLMGVGTLLDSKQRFQVVAEPHLRMGYQDGTTAGRYLSPSGSTS